MEIQDIYVHRIIKERHSKAARLPKGNKLSSIDPLVKALVEKIKELYKTGRTFGSFDEDTENYPFQDDLRKYVDKSQKYTIEDLSDAVLTRLIIEIDKETLATGGYMLFFHFKENGKEWFFVVMLKDKKGYLFNEKLELKDIDELDLNKLHQAIRVDLESWQAADDTAYLSFIKSGNGDIASYFLNTFGCTDSITSKASTAAVYSALKEICDELKIGPRQSRLIKDSVTEFLFVQESEVSLERLANHVDLLFEHEHRGKFLEKANSDDFKISDTFIPHKPTLSNHKKIVAESNHWKISIDRSVIGIKGDDSKVIYDTKEQALIIRGLPTSTIEELETLLKDK